MKTLTLIILTLIFASCSLDKKGGLEKEVQTLELNYIAWACDCSNWATDEILEKYSENIGDTLAYKSIYIEPANNSLELPDTLGYSNDRIKFTGQFYNEKGFPKEYSSAQEPDEARVFRYTNYEVVISNYKNYREAINE